MRFVIEGRDLKSVRVANTMLVGSGEEIRIDVPDGVRYLMINNFTNDLRGGRMVWDRVGDEMYAHFEFSSEALTTAPAPASQPRRE